MIPKGWPMIGKSLAAAAEIEAFEEAGVGGTIDPQPLGTLAHAKRTGFGSIRAQIVVHALKVEQVLTEWPEKDQRTRRWFGIRDALAEVDSGQLRGLIEALAKQLRKTDW
jgi:8-oxo-dGTP pyrophosphatase MutT (NUDIX family)